MASSVQGKRGFGDMELGIASVDLTIKNIKNLITAMIFCSGSISYAGLTCSNFLSTTESDTSNPLEKIQIQIEQAKSLEEATDLTYEKVSLGNQLFDQAIDGIVAINSQPHMNPLIAQQQSQQVNTLIFGLQEAFRIPSFVMGFAISNRLKIEQEERAQMTKAERQRMAAGFHRSELATNFHADPNNNPPVGFGLQKNNEEKIIHNSLLFQELFASFDTHLADTETEPPAQKRPIGFKLHNNENSKNSAPLQQIGFLQQTTETEGFDHSMIPEVALNVNIGEFIVSENQQETTIGF